MNDEPALTLLEHLAPRLLELPGLLQGLPPPFEGDELRRFAVEGLDPNRVLWTRSALRERLAQGFEDELWSAFGAFTAALLGEADLSRRLFSSLTSDRLYRHGDLVMSAAERAGFLPDPRMVLTTFENEHDLPRILSEPAFLRLVDKHPGWVPDEVLFHQMNHFASMDYLPLAPRLLNAWVQNQGRWFVLFDQEYSTNKAPGLWADWALSQLDHPAVHQALLEHEEFDHEFCQLFVAKAWAQGLWPQVQPILTAWTNREHRFNSGFGAWLAQYDRQGKAPDTWQTLHHADDAAAAAVWSLSRGQDLPPLSGLEPEGPRMLHQLLTEMIDAGRQGRPLSPLGEFLGSLVLRQGECSLEVLKLLHRVTRGPLPRLWELRLQAEAGLSFTQLQAWGQTHPLALLQSVYWPHFSGGSYSGRSSLEPLPLLSLWALPAPLRTVFFEGLALGKLEVPWMEREVKLWLAQGGQPGVSAFVDSLRQDSPDSDETARYFAFHREDFTSALKREEQQRVIRRLPALETWAAAAGWQHPSSLGDGNWGPFWRALKDRPAEDLKHPLLRLGARLVRGEPVTAQEEAFWPLLHYWALDEEFPPIPERWREHPDFILWAPWPTLGPQYPRPLWEAVARAQGPAWTSLQLAGSLTDGDAQEALLKILGRTLTLDEWNMTYHSWLSSDLFHARSPEDLEVRLRPLLPGELKDLVFLSREYQDPYDEEEPKPAPPEGLAPGITWLVRLYKPGLEPPLRPCLAPDLAFRLLPHLKLILEDKSSGEWACTYTEAGDADALALIFERSEMTACWVYSL